MRGPRPLRQPGCRIYAVCTDVRSQILHFLVPWRSSPRPAAVSTGGLCRKGIGRRGTWPSRVSALCSPPVVSRAVSNVHRSGTQASRAIYVRSPICHASSWPKPPCLPDVLPTRSPSRRFLLRIRAEARTGSHSADAPQEGMAALGFRRLRRPPSVEGASDFRA